MGIARPAHSSSGRQQRVCPSAHLQSWGDQAAPEGHSGECSTGSAAPPPLPAVTSYLHCKRAGTERPRACAAVGCMSSWGPQVSKSRSPAGPAAILKELRETIKPPCLKAATACNVFVHLLCVYQDTCHVLSSLAPQTTVRELNSTKLISETISSAHPRMARTLGKSTLPDS